MFGLIVWVPKAIKKRITWPRTGYVAYRVGGKSWWTASWGGGFSAAIAAGLGCLMRMDKGRDWIGLAWMGILASMCGVCVLDHPL